MGDVLNDANIRNIQWREYGETVITPLAIGFILVILLCALTLPRRRLLIPLILTACFITATQRIVIGGLDFTMLRLVIVATLGRFIIRREPIAKFGRLDYLMIGWVVSATIAYILLWRSGSAFVNRMGFAFDAIGMYVIARSSVDDIDDVIAVFKVLIVASSLMMGFMLVEQTTGRNFFSIFGGVPEFTVIREGRLRAQGAFSHAILAGTFGATLLPVAWALWHVRGGKLRAYALLGLVSSAIIVYASSSSGPVLSFLAALIAVVLWRVRDYVRQTKPIVLLVILAVHFAMEAPIWHLLARIDITGGSTGYHRFMLIDRAIERFADWALVGVRSTAYWGWGLQDITNMYVLQAVRGGIVTLVFFVVVMGRAFNEVGKTYRSDQYSLGSSKVVYALGAILLTHTISFVGVSYFGQMEFFYYLSIALIGSASIMRPENAPLRERAGIDTARPSLGRTPHGSHA
ncbi:MAG: O-antigen ligase family protein [bacterium]